MLNFLQLPHKPQKPRRKAITTVIDNGIGLNMAEDLVKNANEFIDFIKLGRGSGYVTPTILEKIKLYQNYEISVYFGGTLFEIVVQQNKLNDYKRMLQTFNLRHIEVSNSLLKLDTEKIIKYVSELSKDFIVLSEVGKKDNNSIMSSEEWIEEINLNLKAGAWKIICEGRESGNAGIYNHYGEVRENLLEDITYDIDLDHLIFETPRVSQQIWFINQFGSLVNLGNIGINDVINLETLRLGLRSDTAKKIHFDESENLKDDNQKINHHQSHIFHLAIPCKDIDEAKNFYVNKLNCQLARQYSDRITLNFLGDQLVCHLAPESIDIEPKIYPRHFGITFTNKEKFEQFISLIKQKEIEFFKKPFVRFLGKKEEHLTFFIKDPSNNLLEFKFYHNSDMIY